MPTVGKEYQTYIKLSYPIIKIKKIIEEQIKSDAVLNKKNMMNKAFRKLEEEIKETR